MPSDNLANILTVHDKYRVVYGSTGKDNWYFTPRENLTPFRRLTLGDFSTILSLTGVKINELIRMSIFLLWNRKLISVNYWVTLIKSYRVKKMQYKLFRYHESYAPVIVIWLKIAAKWYKFARRKQYWLIVPTPDPACNIQLKVAAYANCDVLVHPFRVVVRNHWWLPDVSFPLECHLKVKDRTST